MKVQHDLPRLSPHPLLQEVEGEVVAYLVEEVTTLFSREKIVIDFCQKQGHTEDEWWEKMANQIGLPRKIPFLLILP